MNKRLAIMLLIIVIMVAGLGACSTADTCLSLMEEPVYLAITTYMANLTEFNQTYHVTVIGVVQNNLTTNVELVKINATFYDSLNNTIGKSYTPTELEIFKPGAKAPFTLYFSSTEAPALSSTEFIASCVKTHEEPIVGVEILNETLHSYVDENGYHIVTGEVHNNARGRACMVKVICTYYDEKDNVLALSRAFTNPNDIGLGGEASFELSSKPYKIEPARYELLAIAHHYKLIPIVNYILFSILAAGFIGLVIYMKRKRGW